jgi:hypothetical protein
MVAKAGYNNQQLDDQFITLRVSQTAIQKSKFT